MAYRHYTRCYEYPGPLASNPKPFNLKRDLGSVIGLAVTVLLNLILAGALIGLIAGPVGAAIGALIGLGVGIVSSVAASIGYTTDKWLNERLVCLATRPKCAVGIVREGPKHSELGALDNDEFFDLQLMPHRLEDNYVKLGDPANPAADPPRYGELAGNEGKHIKDHPKNEIYLDGFQGEELLKPDGRMLQPGSYFLGYNDQSKDEKEMHTASMLHCEAEGDFWIRMRDLAWALGALVLALVAATAAGTAGGAYAGSAAGCALGVWFFGPVGCAIGAIIGAILGGAAGGAAAGLASKALAEFVLQAIFDADRGDVEDANVGDKDLGPIIPGNRVAVLGHWVYDGFHDGWHEIHPLMAVQKILGDKEPDGDRYLTWDPLYAGTEAPAGLTPDDMRRGLESLAFAGRVKAIRDRWCSELQVAFRPETRETQRSGLHRWTIHPAVDGCRGRD